MQNKVFFKVAILFLFCFSFKLNAVYTSSSIALSFGYNNRATYLDGGNPLAFQNEAYFVRSSLLFELNRFDFVLGGMYLRSQSVVAQKKLAKSQGFGDPFVGVGVHLLYENYYFPEVVIGSNVSIPVGEAPFTSNLWLNYSQLQISKQTRYVGIGFAMGGLFPLGEQQGYEQSIGVLSFSLSRSLLTKLRGSLFVDYYTNGFSDDERVSHLGMQLTFSGLSDLPLSLYGGKELLESSLGWFFGAGLRYFMF